jgi:hypothetical protein
MSFDPYTGEPEPDPHPVDPTDPDPEGVPDAV